MKNKAKYVSIYFVVLITITVTLTNCNTSASEPVVKQNILIDEPVYSSNTDSINSFFKSVIANKYLIAKTIKIQSITPLKTEEEAEEIKILIEPNNDTTLRFISADAGKFPAIVFSKNGTRAYFDNISFNSTHVRGNSSPIFWSMKFKGINYSDDLNSKITLYQLEDNRYGIAIKISNLSSSSPIFKVFVLKN